MVYFLGDDKARFTGGIQIHIANHLRVINRPCY